MTKEEIRLECVRLALGTHGVGSPDHGVVATAQALYAFIVGDDKPSQALKAAA